MDTAINNKIRGISPAIFKKYSYFKDSEGNHKIQHYSQEGNKIATKTRYRDKTFSWDDTVDKNPFSNYTENIVPFGLNLFKRGGKKITITEGELDCLSVAETFKGKYPVISINHTHDTYRKELINNMEYLNSFEEIILWFNNTEESQLQAKDVAELFKPGKVKVVRSNEYMDANEALTKGGINVVSSLFWEANIISPIGIVNANEGGFESMMEDDSSDEYYDTPYTGLEVSKGAITTFVSGTGMGKTTIVKEISYDLLYNKNLRIGYVGLEENNKVSKRGFVGIHLSESIIKKKNWAEFKTDKGNIARLEKAYKEIIEPGNLFLFNHFGSLDSDILIDKLRFLAVGAECDFIILDHISIVVSGQDNNNEVKVIDMLMTKLRSLVEETGVGMILISHLRRPSGDKGHEDGIQVSLSHLRGSGSIAQISDSVIGLEGDQQHLTESNVRTIRNLKDREGGETGILSKAIYIKKTGRLLPYNETVIEKKFEPVKTPTKTSKELNKFLDMEMEKEVEKVDTSKNFISIEEVNKVF